MVKKVRILITVDSLNSGGTERQILELVKGFHKSANCEISVLTLTRNGFYDNAVRSYTTLYSLTQRAGDWKRVSSFQALYRLIKENRFDIVHTMSLEDSSMVYLVSKVLKFRWVNGTIRDADGRRNRRQVQKSFLLKRSKFIVANSFAGLKVYNIHDSRSAKVIYNGVDPGRFTIKNHDTRTENHKEIRFCSVANLSAYKDYYTLIAAIREVKELPISLHIFGDGPLRGQFETIVKEKDLGTKVVFYGKVNNVEAYLPTMDCGVLMSFRKSGEGLPNAILEFMSSGIPVVASNVGGVAEVVKNEVNGLLVEPENVRSLSAAIKRIALDEKFRLFLASNTVPYVKKKFALGRMIEDYTNYYLEVANG
jgi:glycosyltransferase involved in cell wall biosynthesis